jgi:hypothetical protein
MGASSFPTSSLSAHAGEVGTLLCEGLPSSKGRTDSSMGGGEGALFAEWQYLMFWLATMASRTLSTS